MVSVLVMGSRLWEGVKVGRDCVSDREQSGEEMKRRKPLVKKSEWLSSRLRFIKCNRVGQGARAGL